jgi:transcriptional regulator with XRE-family HTH domain
VNLRSLLGMHGLTQRDLAVHLGLSPQGVWNIVHGRSEPRTATASRAARAFGIDPEALFADTGTCVRAAAAAFEHAPVRFARGDGSRGCRSPGDRGRGEARGAMERAAPS